MLEALHAAAAELTAGKSRRESVETGQPVGMHNSTASRLAGALPGYRMRPETLGEPGRLCATS